MLSGSQETCVSFLARMGEHVDETEPQLVATHRKHLDREGYGKQSLAAEEHSRDVTETSCVWLQGLSALECGEKLNSMT